MLPNAAGLTQCLQLCAHRELLLCRERHIALNRELERIKMLHLIKKRIPQLSQRMQATFEVSSINVHLNRNFCIKNDGERDAYAFLALLKAADQVCATEAVTPIGGRTMRVNSVQFNDHILFTELPLDLTITLEIYALKMQEATRPNDRHCAVLRDKAKSLLNPHICVLKQSMTDESVVSSSEFTLCGSVLLNRDTVGTQRFYMDNVEYPLEGTVEVKSCCSAIPPIIETEFSGFLTMYEVVSGLGSWARYWAVLRRAAVHFWKYPDDEAAEKPSVAYMDLTKCVNLKVKRVELDICSHPNTFSVDLLLWTRPCVMEKKRVLLSADTKAQCLAWIDAINETLAILRG
ncbi:Anillin-like protein 2 [Toxocara canis]|uniref:Anillin-like protein 2 n=1 Tax=Toxocara canis TaxID=6265 RepID=A0A0B2UNT4_TOXCA|nr:Anillin-like protein 2 [Toxocara canis]